MSRPCTASARVVSADTTQVQVESTYIIRGFGMQVQHPCGEMNLEREGRRDSCTGDGQVRRDGGNGRDLGKAEPATKVATKFRSHRDQRLEPNRRTGENRIHPPPHPHTLAHRVQLALAGCSLNGDVSVWQTMKRYAGGDVSPQPQPPLCELEARKGGTPCVRVEEQYAPSSGRLGLRVPIVQQEGVRESEEPLVPFGVRRALGNHLIHKHGNTPRRVLGAMELGHAPHSGHGMHVDCTWATALTRAKHNSRKQRVASGDVYSRALGRRSERCARVRECVCVGGGGRGGRAWYLELHEPPLMDHGAGINGRQHRAVGGHAGPADRRLPRVVLLANTVGKKKSPFGNENLTRQRMQALQRRERARVH